MPESEKSKSRQRKPRDKCVARVRKVTGMFTDEKPGEVMLEKNNGCSIMGIMRGLKGIKIKGVDKEKGYKWKRWEF